MKTRLGLGRNTRQIWENLYIIMASVVLVTAVIALVFSGDYPITFALCFFASAIMQICHGTARICPDERHRRSYVWAILLYISAVALLVLGVISLGL